MVWKAPFVIAQPEFNDNVGQYHILVPSSCQLVPAQGHMSIFLFTAHSFKVIRTHLNELQLKLRAVAGVAMKGNVNLKSYQIVCQ